MTTATLTHRLSKQKIKTMALPFISWKLCYGVGFLAVLVLLVGYIFFINQLTGGSYVIKNSEKRLSDLVAENKSLQQQFAQNSFLGDMQARTSELNFEKTENIEYITILRNSLAIR